MSILKKTMACVFGIGGTKVDTIVSSKCIYPGGKIEGLVNIYGGQVNQDIKNVIIDVKTSYEKEYDDKTTIVETVVQRFLLNVDKVINSEDNISLPFSFILDYNCPITKGKSKVWLSTRLDIENAIDSLDTDTVTIKPSKDMETVLNCIRDLGFKLKSTKNIFDKHSLSKYKYVQEFEYTPISLPFRGKLDELEVVIVANNNGLSVLLEVDRKVRGLGSLIAEKLSLDESLIKVEFSYDELQNSQLVVSKIEKIIKKHS
ncbi:MAG: sporulation protein [Peptostreptococcaceae bacterium]